MENEVKTLIQKKLNCGDTLSVVYDNNNNYWSTVSIITKVLSCIVTFDADTKKDKRHAVTWLRQIGSTLLKAADKFESIIEKES